MAYLEYSKHSDKDDAQWKGKNVEEYESYRNSIILSEAKNLLADSSLCSE